MLPTSAIVERVLIEGGAAAKLPTNALIIDMSSSEPLRSRTLAATLTEKALRYLDAPVSGGVRGAVNGALAIMVGGDAADLEVARPIFDQLGRSVIHVGQHGAGHAAKALNNLVSAATVAVTAEAMKTARAFGIDEQVFIDVLNASSGRSNTSENKASQFMLSGTFASGFPIGLMSKDVDIAVALADQLGVDAELSRETAELWKRVAIAGHAGDDHTKMYEFLGTSLVEETQNAVKERMLDALRQRTEHCDGGLRVLPRNAVLHRQTPRRYRRQGLARYLRATGSSSPSRTPAPTRVMQRSGSRAPMSSGTT